MSSLAGALDEYTHPRLPNTHYNHTADEIEMRASKNDSEAQDDEEMEDDLFGNDNDVERQLRTSASPSASGRDSERLPSPERDRRQALEYEEEDAPPEISVEVKEAHVTFPNLPVPKSSDGNNWVIRLPNYVKLDSKPFHPDTYIGPENEDEDTAQSENMREKSMSIKLKVENTVRWRWTKDSSDQDRRESNSRMIRWSDDSLSLRLGKELFDINQSIDTSAGVTRQTIGVPHSQSQSQSQSQPNPPVTPSKSQGLTYLVAQHKRSQVLQSEAIITGYLSLRPTGMQSETHRMLVRAVGQRHNKVSRLRIAPDPTVDPEREKLELMKLTAKKSKKKADDPDGLGVGRKRRNSRRGDDVMWSDDDDDRPGIYGGSEEDDDERSGGRGSPRKMKRKAGEEKGEEYQADDFVVPDDSDDDGEGGARSRKKVRETSEMEEDPLDRLEANLAQQSADKKRTDQKPSSGRKGKKKKQDHHHDDETDEEGGDPMDVESEEEDEEFKVRRVTGKRVVPIDEEEE